MTDFRALCAELLSEIDAGRAAVLNRVTVKLRAALDQPVGEGPSDEAPYEDAPVWYGSHDAAAWQAGRQKGWLVALARWGNSAAPAPKPIPVSERLPEDDDCLVIPPLGASTFPLRYCWQAGVIMHCGQARLIWDWRLVPHTTDMHWLFIYWLPATTRFLPTAVDSACAIPAVQVKEAEA